MGDETDLPIFGAYCINNNIINPGNPERKMRKEK